MKKSITEALSPDVRARLVLENDEVSGFYHTVQVCQYLHELRCVTMPKIFLKYVRNWTSPSFSVSKTL